MKRLVKCGDVEIGGGSCVSIQSMTNTKTTDVEATVIQIRELEEAGCQIVRLAVPDMDAAEAFKRIRSRCMCRWWRIYTSITVWPSLP